MLIIIIQNFLVSPKQSLKKKKKRKEKRKKCYVPEFAREACIHQGKQFKRVMTGVRSGVGDHVQLLELSLRATKA